MRRLSAYGLSVTEIAEKRKLEAYRMTKNTPFIFLFFMGMTGLLYAVFARPGIPSGIFLSVSAMLLSIAFLCKNALWETTGKSVHIVLNLFCFLFAACMIFSIWYVFFTVCFSCGVIDRPAVGPIRLQVNDRPFLFR